MTDTKRDTSGLTPHELQNQASWDADSDDYQARHGEQLAASTGLAWARRWVSIRRRSSCNSNAT